MFGGMGKNLMTNDIYDVWAAGLLNSTVQIQTSATHLPRIILSNKTCRVHIHRTSPSIKYDLQSKDHQIMNK